MLKAFLVTVAKPLKIFKPKFGKLFCHLIGSNDSPKSHLNRLHLRAKPARQLSCPVKYLISLICYET